MISSLVREQLRSQRRFAIAAGVLIAAAIAIAVYGTLMTATMVTTAEHMEAFTGPTRETEVTITVPQDQSLDEVTRGIDEANASGGSVVAWAFVGAHLPGSISAEEIHDVQSFYGDIDWSARLTAGREPGPGEIAIAESWATEHGVATGDTIYLEAETYSDGEPSVVADPLDAPLTVSGLTRSSVAQGGIDVAVPSAYVAWEDSELISAAAFATSHEAKDQGVAYEHMMFVHASGDGDWMWFDTASADTEDLAVDEPLTGSTSFFRTLGLVGVTALLIGIFAAAFALGRAQAQARSRWVATVRALGATQEQVLWATAIEAMVIGLAAGVAGYLLGTGAAAIHLGLVLSSVPGAMLVPATSFALPILAGALLFGVILALAVGAVPAFWSSRIEPAAGLKPVADLADVRTSRTVGVRPFLIAWLAALGVAIYGTLVSVDGPAALAVVVAVIVLIVAGLMLAHEALRASLPWHARWLSRSRRRAIMVAGDAILARPRQSTVPAFIAALATCILMGIFVPLVAFDSTEVSQMGSLGTPGIDNLRYAHVTPLIYFAVFAIVTLLCVAISVATATLTAREAAAREALGVSPAESRLAASVQYLVAQTHGLILGLLGGTVLSLLVLPQTFDWAYAVPEQWIGPATVVVFVILACGAACALAGAAVVSAFRPATSPLTKLEAAA